MNLKTLTRACIFSLSLSFIGFSSFELKADLSGDCIKATQVAQRIKAIIINALTSGDIKLLAMVQTYLDNLNASDPVVQTMINTIKNSWNSFIDQLRATRRLVPSRIEPHLIATFDQFGSNILRLAKEIRSTGNNPELLELSMTLEKLPQEVEQEFNGMSQPQKLRFGTNVWRTRTL
jgi:hypothetical protein